MNLNQLHGDVVLGPNESDLLSIVPIGSREPVEFEGSSVEAQC